MPLPTPNGGEKDSEFVSRCISAVFEDGTLQGRKLDANSEADREQVTAVCYGQLKERAVEEATGYGAKKGQQIRGRLWRGGGGRFVGGPSDEALADIGLERSQSDALIGLLAGNPVNSVMAEQLRNLGLLSPTNKFTEYGKALAQALKDKDADEAKRLLGLAKPKGKGGGGGGAPKKPTAEEIKMANRRDVVAGVLEQVKIPENILNLFFDFADGATSVSDELLAKIANYGLVEPGKGGYYKQTIHGKKFLTAANKKLVGDAIAALQKAQSQEEAETMPVTDIGQIAKSAIETALAVVRDTGEISQERATKMLYALEADLAEIWQPGNGVSVAQAAEFDVDGERVTLDELIAVYREAVMKTVTGKQYPASDFLVVEDPEKSTTWHLQVKRNGEPDHNLMGAAWAALHRGYRGNKYAGPNKQDAITKLTALYKSEEMETPASEANVPGLRELLEQALALLPSDESETITESASEATGLEDFTGDLAELGIDAVAETGRRAPVLVDFQILEPGPGNKRDNHYYPRDMVARDAHVFKGVDVFATDHKEAERSENTKVARVLECPARFTETGAPVAQVVIYDPHQAEKARNRADSGQLSTLECSIYARGIAKSQKIDGKEYKVVEAITEGKYLELVSSAGAGGHALNLSESNTGGNEMENTEQEVTEAQVEDIQESEPAPVEEEPTEEAQTVEEAAPERLAEADVEAALGETNLPKAFKAALKRGEYADADALKSAIAESIAEVKALTGSGQPFGHGDTQPVQESAEDKEKAAQQSFDRIMGEVGLEKVYTEE